MHPFGTTAGVIRVNVLLYSVCPKKIITVRSTVQIFGKQNIVFCSCRYEVGVQLYKLHLLLNKWLKKYILSLPNRLSDNKIKIVA